MAFSALLCGWANDEKEALQAIADYKKQARIGGVLNLSEVNSWSEEVMRARRHETHAKTELRKLKLKPMSCKDALVAKLAWCMTDDVRGHGECDGAQPYYAIAREDE